MSRSTHLIISLTFAIGCLGLWLGLMAMPNMFQATHPDTPLPGFTSLCLQGHYLLLLLPIPVLLFSLAQYLRRTVSTEGVLLYGAMLSLLYVILFFTVALAWILPWIALTTIVRGF